MNDVMMNLMTDRGERIIRYLNIIQIVAAQHYYSYLYSGDFFKPNNICIRIWSSKHYSLTSGTYEGRGVLIESSDLFPHFT